MGSAVSAVPVPAEIRFTRTVAGMPTVTPPQVVPVTVPWILPQLAVKRLRRKLRALSDGPQVQTVRGVGYRLATPAEAVGGRGGEPVAQA